MLGNDVRASKSKLDTPSVNFGFWLIGFCKQFSDAMPYFTEFQTLILDYWILIPEKYGTFNKKC